MGPVALGRHPAGLKVCRAVLVRVLQEPVRGTQLCLPPLQELPMDTAVHQQKSRLWVIALPCTKASDVP